MCQACFEGSPLILTYLQPNLQHYDNHGAFTFEGELKICDPRSALVKVTKRRHIEDLIVIRSLRDKKVRRPCTVHELFQDWGQPCGAVPQMTEKGHRVEVARQVNCPRFKFFREDQGIAAVRIEIEPELHSSLLHYWI
jgi:hypothetical protein